MPTILHKPTSRVRADCNWLSAHARDVASQAGQDGVLQKIFEIIEPQSRLAVEFGGFDGKTMSNTWRLIVEDGWSGIFVEADAERCRQIKLNHPGEHVKALNQFIAWDGPDTFDETMRRAGVSGGIDLLSMDIDGNEWHCWKAIERCRPRVVVVEFNPTVPNDVYFVQDPDVRVNQGSSLLAMIEMGRDKGYALVCVLGMDAIFVLRDDLPRFEIPDNGIDAMFCPVQTLLFQGYDGTLFTTGLQFLAWKNVAFASDHIQLLGPGERFFGDRRA